MAWQPGMWESLSATGLASQSSALEVYDWPHVGPGASTTSLPGTLLRPSYMSLSKGTPMPGGQNLPGGRAEPPSSQSFWGLCASMLGVEDQSRGAIPGPSSDLVAEATSGRPELSHRGGHSIHSPEEPRGCRSADMAVSSEYSRGHHRFQHP